MPKKKELISNELKKREAKEKKNPKKVKYETLSQCKTISDLKAWIKHNL